MLTEPCLQPSTHFLSNSTSSQLFSVTSFFRPLYFPLDGYCVGTVLHPAVFILQKSIDHLCTSVYGKYRRFKAEIYQCGKAILRRTVYSCYVCPSGKTSRSPGTAVIYSSQLPFTKPVPVPASQAHRVTPVTSQTHTPHPTPRQLITLLWVLLCAFETKGNWTNLFSKTPKTSCFGQLVSILATLLSKKG